MGFIVNKKVDFPGGISLDNFYVRIESYHLHKRVGQLDVIMGHYIDKIGAEAALPSYVENIQHNNAYATLPYDLKIEDKEVKTERILSFPLSGSEKIPVVEKITREQNELVDQETIDYDDDGNEIKTFSKKLVKVPITEEFTALKTKVYDYNFKEENIIDFAYSRVKNIYETKFGSGNIENLE